MQNHVYLYSFQTVTKGSPFFFWSLIYQYIQLTVSIYSIWFSKMYVPMKSLPVYLQGISVLQNLLMTLCRQLLPLPLAPDNHWSAFSRCLPFLEFQINGIIQPVLFCAWPFTNMFLRCSTLLYVAVVYSFSLWISLCGYITFFLTLHLIKNIGICFFTSFFCYSE